MARRGMKQNTGQLAFDWGETGEAPIHPRQGFPPSSAPAEPRTLAPELMEQVVARENMKRALKQVRANKGSPGVDGMTVDELPEHLRQHWPALRQQLLEGTYQPQPVKRTEIPKPDGKGMRQLGIPCAVDRLIQQALLQVLEPHYDPAFSPHSYGFRPRKSAHQALEAARGYVEEGRRWVVDLDLEKFFDRVNHDVLMGRLARRITDQRMLRLIRRYLEAGVMINGVVIERWEGTPQGGPLSPLLANILLDERDQELERRGHRFCRYADDGNIYVHSRRAGERVMQSVTRFLEKKLRLKVNRDKSAVDRPLRRKFLGFRIWDGKQPRLLIAPQSRKRFQAKIRAITRRSRGVSLDEVIQELRTYIGGWMGYFWRAHTTSVFQELDSWIRRRLRCFQWKQWKRPRTRARRLIRAGVKQEVAWQAAYCGAGHWRMAHSPAMRQALPNHRLQSLGHLTLMDRYQALASS